MDGDGEIIEEIMDGIGDGIEVGVEVVVEVVVAVAMEEEEEVVDGKVFSKSDTQFLRSNAWFLSGRGGGGGGKGGGIPTYTHHAN